MPALAGAGCGWKLWLYSPRPACSLTFSLKQALCLDPSLLQGLDVVGMARTGSGKCPCCTWAASVLLNGSAALYCCHCCCSACCACWAARTASHRLKMSPTVPVLCSPSAGKTAAFVIPLIEKLKAHSARAGARAVILSPTRELALQAS